MAEHALLSASSAYRWLECTRAPRFEAQFADSSSVYALEGTIAHAIGEWSLKTGRPAAEVTAADVPELNELVKVFPDHTPEELQTEISSMADHVQGYVDYVMSLPGTRYIENRVDFSEFVPEGFGTSDAIVLQDQTIDVVDLKYGKGKKVDADSPQGKLYAIGALAKYAFIFEHVEQVRIHIYQPRLDHIDVFEISRAELLAWAVDYVKPRAQLAFAGQGDFNPGNHCDFCRGRAVCKARAEANLAIAMEEFGEPCPSGERLTLEDLGSLLPRLGQIAKWAEEVQEHALAEALAGHEIPGYKVVEGRSTRKWEDEAAVADAMREKGLTDEQIYNIKIIGITDAEKLLGKKSEVLEMATRLPGKPTLAVLSDKRPPMSVSSAARDFAEET
jgi:hypothetical protein